MTQKEIFNKLKDLYTNGEFIDNTTIKKHLTEDYESLIDLRNRIAEGNDDDTELYEEDHITLDHILDYMEIFKELLTDSKDDTNRILDILEDLENTNNFLDIESLHKIAQEKNIDYIIQAIEEQNAEELRNGLICYINLNDYDLSLYIDKIQESIINF